jgi:ribosomal protein L24E
MAWYIAKLKSSVFFSRKKCPSLAKKSEKPRQHAQKMTEPIKKRGQTEH